MYFVVKNNATKHDFLIMNNELPITDYQWQQEQ